MASGGGEEQGEPFNGDSLLPTPLVGRLHPAPPPTYSDSPLPAQPTPQPA
jgi:hypothetical protein